MTDRSRAQWISAVFLFLLVACLTTALAQRKPPQLSTPEMPYVFHDDRDSAWDIQQDGSIGSGGNNLFDGGGHLVVGDSDYSAEDLPKLDRTTKELCFPGMAIGNLTVKRRVWCNPKLSFIRYTEILENFSGAAVKTTLHVSYNLAGGVQYSSTLGEEGKNKPSLGLIVGDDSNCVALVGAIDGGKIFPRYVSQRESQTVDVYWDVEVPARKTLAIVHLVVRRSNSVEAAKVLTELAGKNVLKGLPPEVTHRLANFPRSEKFASQEELLRGGAFDVIELRDGDQYRGALLQEQYKLHTFFGPVELPPSRVIAELSSGEVRPRQLLVTTDGEIFGGTLQSDSIPIQLASGQSTRVPLAQIVRMGYRKRAGEPEELKIDKPFVSLRGGERMFVAAPTSPIRVATRYGTLSLEPETIAALVFAGEDQSVHQVQLTDGSKFTGIIGGDAFEMKLTTTGQSVAFPSGMLRRIQLSTRDNDADADTAGLQLTNGDELVGTLAGVVNVQTAFDLLKINGNEIRTIDPGKGAGGAVQITLWDNAPLNGQLDSDRLAITLASGVAMKVPVSLIEHYANPQPLPPVQVVERIKAIVTELNADDWASRDRAQAQLIAIGPGAVGLLTELRAAQPPEAQQRIDVVLKADEPAPPQPPAPQNFRRMIVDW